MNPLADARLAFVGGGLMAEALMRGVLQTGQAAPAQIIASDPLLVRRQYLETQLGVQVTDDNRAAVQGAGVVVLAIKPQQLDVVLAGLQGALAPDALLVSIVAGAALATLEAGLGHTALVRVMPNTPGQVGEGMSVWTASPAVPASQREQARALVAALGEELYVDEEKYVDMATAVSGSGPAYVFLFIEALTDAAVHLGFSRPVAEKLALQTVRGSAAYAQRSGTHPAILRNMVTSPGGTTAEALLELERGGLRAALSAAVWASYRRGLELGGPKR